MTILPLNQSRQQPTRIVNRRGKKQYAEIMIKSVPLIANPQAQQMQRNVIAVTFSQFVRICCTENSQKMNKTSTLDIIYTDYIGADSAMNIIRNYDEEFDSNNSSPENNYVSMLTDFYHREIEPQDLSFDQQKALKQRSSSN